MLPRSANFQLLSNYTHDERKNGRVRSFFEKCLDCVSLKFGEIPSLPLHNRRIKIDTDRRKSCYRREWRTSEFICPFLSNVTEIYSWSRVKRMTSNRQTRLRNMRENFSSFFFSLRLLSLARNSRLTRESTRTEIQIHGRCTFRSLDPLVPDPLPPLAGSVISFSDARDTTACLFLVESSGNRVQIARGTRLFGESTARPNGSGNLIQVRNASTVENPSMECNIGQTRADSLGILHNSACICVRFSCSFSLSRFSPWNFHFSSSLWQIRTRFKNVRCMRIVSSSCFAKFIIRQAGVGGYPSIPRAHLPFSKYFNNGNRDQPHRDFIYSSRFREQAESESILVAGKKKGISFDRSVSHLFTDFSETTFLRSSWFFKFFSDIFFCL